MPTERNRLGKATLDESNPYSLIPDGRSPQRDFYKISNRDKQLDAVESLSEAEQAYVLGGAETGSEARNGQAPAAIKKALNKLHEKDLIELRAMVYLQRLPDTSPELNQLRIMTNLHSREQIAEFIAEKQLKKLMMSQIEKITGGDQLTNVYKETIKKGPNTFLSLWN